MRPEDYRLVFLSSDSSCREDTEDSSSTASSAAPPAPDDCDWDYFEPGAAAAQSTPPPPKHAPQVCPRQCSCGAEPRIVAVPVPVPVPVPAALWPALLAFPTQAPPTPHWSTYPGFPPLDAAALARLTTAAAVAVTAAASASASATATASASLQNNKIEMTTVERTDKAIQSETSQLSEALDSDNVDNAIELRIENENSVGIKVIAEEDRLSVVSEQGESMPEHLEAEKAFPSSNDSGDSSDSDAGVARRSYDLTSGAPEEPATTDEDSDDSGGGGGRFSRVFVVNPADSSSDLEDNADSSGIDCDDSYDKKSDSLEIIAEEMIMQNEIINLQPNDNRQQGNEIVLLDSVDFSEEYPVIIYENVYESDDSNKANKSNLAKFCDENMLRSETCEEFNSFNVACSSSSDNVDNVNDVDNNINRYQNSISNDIECDSLSNSFYSDTSDMKVKVSVELLDDSYNNKELGTTEIPPAPMCNLVPSPKTDHEESCSTAEKIDLFKGIERTLSELLKKELMQEQEAEKIHACRPVCSETVGGACTPAATTVCRSRTPCADGSARFTSRVMITHDRVSVVTSDTTQLMRDITVQHTNSQNETEPDTGAQQNENDERNSDDETPQPSGGVTVVSNADTLSAVVCLEEGLADDDSWVEDVSHDDDEATTTSDTDSGDEASLPSRGDDFSYCRRSLDFTLHTIVEESCEESETEHTTKKPRPLSATELEKYFFFGLGDGRIVREDEEAVSETSSVCSEGGESIVDSEQPKRNSDSDDLVSSRLEKYFLSGFMGFNQERRDSDGSGSVGSDSEGRQSPEQRRKRLVRARGTPRSHSSSLDNLLTGEEQTQDGQEVSDASSTETEDRHDSSDRLDMQGECKRKKQAKKTRGSPADERRQSAEFTEETRDDTRSVSEGEDSNSVPRPEFPPLGSELSESKKQASRDSGFVGSCDDLLRNSDNSSDFRSHELKTELEEIVEEIRPDLDERLESSSTSRPPQSQLTRKDSFNNWSSDEETNLMMTKMRQFFKQMIHTGNVRTSTPASTNSESSRPPKPPQLLYFESELTRLMKTVPGIRDEEVREIVEYLSSEDTWSDSYDSSDYAGSDMEGTAANRTELRKQISESCREIIDEFDRGNGDARSLERDAAGAYRKLAATLGRAGEGSPPLFGKVMRHIGGRLVALMHEVSGGASPSTDDDSASEPGALARSKSHDILEATASRGSVASDCERFSWRGSFESALLAADSRGTLGGAGCEARRSPAALDLAAQKSHSRSCGAISGSEDRLWRGRRRASAPDAESEEEQRSGSLPRLPSVTGTTATPVGPVKSARYRAPGFRTATRAASAPGLHVPRRRRPPPTPQQPPPAAPASAPSLQDEVYTTETLLPGHATLPRRSNSPLPNERDTLERDRFPVNRSGLQARSESMASVYSGAGEGTRCNVTVRGEVQFSLLYNYRLGALEVGVKRCRDLAPIDAKRNRSDPYVKVYLLPDKSKAGKRKTKVKKNTLNPVFEETLSFAQTLASLSSRTLWLSVWHADMFGRNDFLGEVSLPLADVVFDDPAPTWYKLHERTEHFDEQQGTRGDLIVGLKFELHETGAMRGKGTLHVLVKEAKNLVATKPNGLADVFCKSYLLPERGRLAKQKTSVARRTLSPRWEHTFTYRGLKPQDLAARALELSLWDRDRLASNDFMGAVRLSLGTGTYMGANVNWMDSAGKEVSLWQTMMERPNFWVEGSLPLRPQLIN
nr:pneumococcal serine-rich repeat protein isoform X4 [Bombyx mori]